MNDREVDWGKVQTVEQLKTVVKLIVSSFGGSGKLFISYTYFDSASEETKKRLEAICKEEK
jgi:hypothetical protein